MTRLKRAPSIAKKHAVKGRIFGCSISAFRKGVERAGLALPVGQMTHVLRHTFVSHFMMNASNILTLQCILGHASLTMTMRYSHLSPEHLQEAKNLNPLSRLTLDCHPPMTNGFHFRATR